MAISFRPPKTTQKVVPIKPPKGHFFFAGRAFPRVPWWKRANLRRLYIYIVILILTNTANGFDGSMMNGLQSLSYWQDYFGEPRGAMLGFFNSSMSLGSLIGLFFTPYLIDWKGRKIGVAIGCVIMLFAVAIQTGAQNIGMFIAARLVLGFGDTIVLGSAPLLIAEIAHPQDRAVLVTLSGASYHSGAFIASWVTYGTLQMKNLHVGYATKTATKKHSPCSPAGTVKEMTMTSLSSSNLPKYAPLSRLTKNKTEPTGQTSSKPKATVRESSSSLRLASSANGVDNVGLTDPQTQLGINGGMKTLALCENFLFAFLVDKLGRRPIYLYDIAPRAPLGKGFIVSIFFYGIFYDIKSGIMAGYTTEILPYGLRAKGFTWLNFCVTAALFFNQFVNGIALEALAWKYYICYCVFLAFEIGVIYFCIVETRYTPMEEIARFFDGDDAVDVGEAALMDVKEKGVSGGEKDVSVSHIEVTK
ncbi:general substrate transporter [Alternaria alternata]|nr:general substrate transporter [Alternaria alternata]